MHINGSGCARKMRMLNIVLGLVALSALPNTGWAGSCDPLTFVCSGAADSENDVMQVFNGIDLHITTSPGFGMDVQHSGNMSNGLYISSNGGLSFIDDNHSNINGGGWGVIAKNGTGFIGAGDFGDMTLLLSGNVTGGRDGAFLANYAEGAMDVTTTGTMRGGDTGMTVVSLGTLTLNANHSIGGNTGLFVFDGGAGDMLINTTGDLTGTGGDGLFVFRLGGDSTLNIFNATGGINGINVDNFNSGDTHLPAGTLSIHTRGVVTGFGGYGITTEGEEASGATVRIGVGSGSKVQGGLAGIHVNTGAAKTIENEGIIRNLSQISSDLAIYTEGGGGTTINNKSSGLIIGTVKLGGGENTFNNDGVWYTAGGTNDFGGDGSGNALNNYGSVMAASNRVDGSLTTTFDNVGKFNNYGTLRMDNDRAGDTLIINGDFDGKGGRLILNTELGGDDSATDKLVINGDSSGTTWVTVKNVGGSGAQTLNGIEIVEVNGISAGEFIKYGRIVAGAFDYSLVRGGGENSSNWYLTSGASPIEPIAPIQPVEPPIEPMPPIDPPIDPIDPIGPQVQRPEGGAYTANLAAANNMFASRLNDRIGETQYIDAVTGERKLTSLWLRNEAGHSRSQDSSGQLRTQANRYVMQIGGDIAQWESAGAERFRLGLMAGYGNSKSTTSSTLSGYSAKGTTDGYSAGVYGTWQGAEADKSGLYVDGWAQYGWFNNSVQGQELAREEYKSKGFTASVESGYTLAVGGNTFIQPKAQLTWMGVKADDHTEENGTGVSSEGINNIQTRLGLRAFIKGQSTQDKSKNRIFEPFVEANWLHNTHAFGTKMDGVSVQQDGAANIAELKVGVESQLYQQFDLWGNVAQQIGDKGYSDTTVLLGVKYKF